MSQQPQQQDPSPGGQVFHLTDGDVVGTMDCILWEMCKNDVLTDVTIGTEGKWLKAHRVILAAGSAYFRSVLVGNTCTQPIIILKDVQYDDMVLVLRFLYKKQVSIPEHQLQTVFSTAVCLQISALIECIYKLCHPPAPQIPAISPNEQELEGPADSIVPMSLGAGESVAAGESVEMSDSAANLGPMRGLAVVRREKTSDIVELAISELTSKPEVSGTSIQNGTEATTSNSSNETITMQEEDGQGDVKSKDRTSGAKSKTKKRTKTVRIKPVVEKQSSKRRSYVWDHFTSLPECKYQCRHCDHIMTMSGGASNSHLMKHLKNKHCVVKDSPVPPPIAIFGSASPATD